MTKQAIYAVHAEPWYGQGQGEDGYFNYRGGWNVVASVHNTEDGCNYHYLYKGEGELIESFDEQAKAEQVVTLVQKAGEIDEAFWHLQNIDDPNELPDYVTNWWRPEYN
jgi:hypothetical protein